MGFTQARRQAILNAELVDSDFIGYSTNGTSETANLARTAVGSWSAATAANPSVRANAGALTTAAATGAANVTHFAVVSASTGGTQKVEWQALTAAKNLATGDTGTWAAGALGVSLSG